MNSLYYEKILKLRNDHAPSFNNMGDIYLSLKNYEKAIKCFSEAIKLEPVSYTHLTLPTNREV